MFDVMFYVGSNIKPTPYHLDGVVVGVVAGSCVAVLVPFSYVAKRVP
jgi:hypothetical protein